MGWQAGWLACLRGCLVCSVGWLVVRCWVGLVWLLGLGKVRLGWVGSGRVGQLFFCLRDELCLCVHGFVHLCVCVCMMYF